MYLWNKLDGNGRTPLHQACASGKVEDAAMLLLAGADINAR